MATDFIVHERVDQVGVAVRDISNGEKVEGWVMEDDSTVQLTATRDIPLGHKIAVLARKPGEAVIKYGRSIGLATTEITVGEHVHVHNLKTTRW